MSTISVNDLTNRLQNTIDSINKSIRSNNYGTDTIDKLAKQKTILLNHIADLSVKDVINEEDEKNTTRLIAIAETKQQSAEPKGGSSNVVVLFVLIAFSFVALYYKKNK